MSFDLFSLPSYSSLSLHLGKKWVSECWSPGGEGVPMTASFALTGSAGFCNAVRRTLLSDLYMWAPKEILIRSNMSCQTDEYLAHRIGMIPFRKTGEGDSISLKARGPGMVWSSQFTGCAFKSLHNDIEIMLLDNDQELDLTIRFDRQRASKHARYSPCAAVGMTKIGESQRYNIRFSSIVAETPKELMLQALDSLDQRVDNALLAMANQPDPPPQSMC